MPNLTAPHPAQDTRSAGRDTVIGAYPAAVGEQAPTLAGQREHPAGTARQPTLPGETAQLVKVIQLVFGARRAGDVPPEPARVLLDQRPAEVTGLGEGYPAVQFCQQPPLPGQRVRCCLRREFRGLQQPVGHGADDPLPRLAAPGADPGLGPLGHDHRGE